MMVKMRRNATRKSQRCQVTALSKYTASKFSARHHENVAGVTCHSAGRRPQSIIRFGV